MLLIFLCVQINTYPFMKKISASKSQNCQKHSLVLTPKNTKCFYSRRITASFCDQSIPYSKSTKTKAQQIQQKIKHYNGPVFNTDKNYASLGFILHSEINYYQKNTYHIRCEYQKNMQDYSHEKTPQINPKPRSKTKYCNVCKCNYQEYIQHISSDSHKQKIKSSKFNNYILELQKQFAQKNINNRFEQTKSDDKILADKSTEIKQNSIGDDDSIELLYVRKPRKIVKIDSTKNKSQNIMPNASIPNNFGQFWNAPHPLTNINFPYIWQWFQTNLILANLYGYQQMNMLFYDQNQYFQAQQEPNEINGHTQMILEQKH